MKNNLTTSYRVGILSVFTFVETGESEQSSLIQKFYQEVGDLT